MAVQITRRIAAAVTASGALTAGQHQPVNATSGNLTMTLPASPTQGAHLSVEKVDSTKNTVAITGTIRGVASSTVTLTWQYETVELTADGTGSWWVLAGHKTKTALDATYGPLPSKAVTQVSCYGDSLTQGIGGGGIDWPTILSQYAPVPVNNYGVSGQYSSEIALRQGGLDVFVTITGDQIPASGSVGCTVLPGTDPTASDYFRSGFDWTFPGTLYGIPGYLEKSTSNVWTFTRNTAGTVTTIARETRFVSGQAPTAATGVVIWSGRNNPVLPLAADHVITMANQAKKLGCPYIILPVTNQTNGYVDEPSGSSGYNAVMAVNAQYALDPNYYDMRSYLIRQGLRDAGITPTSSDTTAISNDQLPPSLLYDGLHLNGAGYTVLGKRLVAVMADRGWFTTTITRPTPPAVGGSTAAVGFAGTGTLTTVATSPGVVMLSGAGTLTTTGKPAFAATSAFAGTGTLTTAVGSGVTDNFNRADNSTTLGTTTTGALTWAYATASGAPTPAFGITSNQAAYQGTPSNEYVAYIDDSLPNSSLQVTMAVTPQGSSGIVFRYQDYSNFWVAFNNSGNWSFAKKVSGSYTVVSTGATAANGDILKVLLSGSSLILNVNGTQSITTTDSFLSTATKKGLWVSSSAGSPTRWDDLSII